MECMLFKIQYVGKAETTFNLGLNNDKKNAKEANFIFQPAIII